MGSRREIGKLPIAATFLIRGFAQSVATVHVDATPGHVINSFDPDQAIGSSIDNLNKAAIDKVYTPHIIQEALDGYGPITYRNNTELRMMAWHWNDRGTWSDPANKSGYWTSSSEFGEPMRWRLRNRVAIPERNAIPQRSTPANRADGASRFKTDRLRNLPGP